MKLEMQKAPAPVIVESEGMLVGPVVGPLAPPPPGPRSGMWS